MKRLPQLNHTLCDRDTAGVVHNHEKQLLLPDQEQVGTLATFIQHCTRSPRYSNKARKRNESLKIRYKHEKLALIADDTALCVKT